MTDTLKIVSWDQNSMKAVISINNEDNLEIMVPWENDSIEKVQSYLGQTAQDYLTVQAQAAAQVAPVMPVLDLSSVVGQDLPVPVAAPISLKIDVL